MLDSVAESQGCDKGDEGELGGGNGADVPDKAPSAPGLTANQQLSRRSKYTVPSQTCEVDGIVDLTMDDVDIEKMPADDDRGNGFLDESDDASFLLGVGSSKQGTNAFHDYMPMYQEICKQASAPGEYGKKSQVDEWEVERVEERNVQLKRQHEQ